MGLFLSYKATINVVYYKKNEPPLARKKNEVCNKKKFYIGLQYSHIYQQLPLWSQISNFCIYPYISVLTQNLHSEVELTQCFNETKALT